LIKENLLGNLLKPGLIFFTPSVGDCINPPDENFKFETELFTIKNLISMIVKIPVYYQIEILGNPKKADQDVLREVIHRRVEDCLEENLNKITLRGGGLIFSSDDRIEATFKSISDVHEILRTKK